MEHKETEFLNAMNQRICQCRDQEERLQDEDRKDEAIFEKIRQNVYEIFLVIFEGIQKRISANESMEPEETKVKVYKEFERMLANIPSSWKKQLMQANQFQDEEKQYVEALKLSVVEEIRELFEKLYGER